MSKVTIFGSSDDLIEIEGDFADEFFAYDGWKYLHFSDGTVIKCGYDLVEDKGWHIHVVKLGATDRAHWRKSRPLLRAAAVQKPPKLQDGCHYTDVLELEGDFDETIKCWSSAEGPTETDVADFWDNFDVRDYSYEQLMAAHRALMKIA